MTTARRSMREAASQCVNGQGPDSGRDGQCHVIGRNVCEGQRKDATFDTITKSESDTDAEGRYSNSSTSKKIGELSKYGIPGSSNITTVSDQIRGGFGTSRPFVAKVAASKRGKLFVFDSDDGTSSNPKAGISLNLNRTSYYSTSNRLSQEGPTSVPISAKWGASIGTHSNTIKATHRTAASTRVEQETHRSDTGGAWDRRELDAPSLTQERLLVSCPLCTEKFSDRWVQSTVYQSVILGTCQVTCFPGRLLICFIFYQSTCFVF